MDNVGSRLMQELKDLSEVEIQKLEVQFAKFNKEVYGYYALKIEAIENNIDNQIRFFGKKPEKCQEEKDYILGRYKDEFQKTYNKRREQFFNLQVEIQELEANQKIAVANFKKIVEDKNKILRNNIYSDYMGKRKEFQRIINTTLNHNEFDKYSKLLDELDDPLEIYTKKLNALINKYAGYNEIIIECEKKLYECIRGTKNDFDQITKYRNNNFIVIKEGNFIINFFKKISRMFNGRAKLEKDVFEKMEEELVDIEENNLLTINSINDQTINIVGKIEELRDVINLEFKLAME